MLSCWTLRLGLSRIINSRRRKLLPIAGVWLCLSTTSRTTTAFSTTPQQQKSMTIIHPPVPLRQEDAVVYAGVAPPGWNVKEIPRQGADSKEALLDPPVPIANPYGWMRDESRSNPQVLEHLKLENEYTQKMTQHLQDFQQDLYQESKGKLVETDATVPRPKGGKYYYYSRTFEGQSYKAYCRAPISNNDKDDHYEWNGAADTPVLPGEVVYLDVNALGKDQSYCSLGAVATSPSQEVVAYTIDLTGDEIYALVVQTMDGLNKTTIFQDDALQTSGNVVWGADDTTLYYMKMDSNHRPYQLWKKTLNDDSEDVLLHEDLDDLYWGHVSKSQDDQYLFLEFSSKETSELYALNLQDPQATLQCVAPKRSKVLVDLEHQDGTWWIWSNVGGTPNMRLFTCPVGGTIEDWKLAMDPTISTNDKPLFDGSHEISMDDVQVFQNHVVVQGRQGGIPRIFVLDTPTPGTVTKMTRLEFPEAAHDVGLAVNYDYETSSIAIAYDSLVTPPQTLDISLTDVTDRKVLKTKAIPDYDASLYRCERFSVLSRDGTTQIPISVLYHKDTLPPDVSVEDGINDVPVPVHLYGYGSYGSCVEADFRTSRLPLVDRGMVYILAHIRGGGEMGRPWYEEPNGAKYLCKKNTFNDFVDVARWLVQDRKLTSSDLLSCEGRSAGGMLIGSSINQAPELFKVAMMGVPFVDVVATMIDASIPLTAAEWVEWGNPNEEKYFQYMMEYCPMQTVKAGAKYPACWLTGGLHDPRVQYWEPTKFVATLRHAISPESGPICLKIDTSAGHFSASDRYKYLKELAYDYAFLLDQLGLVDEKYKTKANKEEL